jgi:membrane-associated phospholipid phosphatase
VDAKTGYIPVHHRQSAVFEQPESKGFVYPVSDTLVDRPPSQFYGHTGLTYDQALGGPEGFLYDIGVATTGNWFFQPNTWWTGTLSHKLLDDYNKFIYPASNSTLPQVRTLIEHYVATPGVTMPVFQMTHVGKLDNENFYSVYGGMLEMMYGGVGAEWLYRPWQSTVAFGVDINEVKQRGFSQDFSFLDPQYKVMTGHASLYWEGINDINATVRVGRYLAGDMGATLDLSRVFRNGVKMGAFATKTNVSAAQFGEGSFDKGIYVMIPFDAFLIRSSPIYGSFSWHPLSRDGGAMLSRQFPLWDLTGKQSGDLLKWHPFDDERKTQFGDVPDNFSDISHDSVFTAAGKDLTEFGHTATTPDFWRSMLMIGGISLASAILDKPLDKLAVKHGSGGIMKKVEMLGSDLPFAVMGYAGMAFLANDQDSGLARTSYSSLAAGGEGFMASLALKYMVGRARPTAEQGAASFTPVSKSNSNSSWPSMHTTVMWAAVTPYAKAYDASWLYGLAAVTNVARVAGRNHFFSDTVAGSLLGYAIGDSVWNSHKTKKHGADWVVSPNGVTAYWKIE